MNYTMITTEELKAKLETVERQRYYLQMKDHFNAYDWIKDANYSSEINEIKKELAARA